jgi:hypothetical protein
VASLTCIFASVLPRSLLSARTTCAQWLCVFRRHGVLFGE